MCGKIMLTIGILRSLVLSWLLCVGSSSSLDRWKSAARKRKKYVATPGNDRADEHWQGQEASVVVQADQIHPFIIDDDTKDAK
jgi:hypothetical protein